MRDQKKPPVRFGCPTSMKGLLLLVLLVPQLALAQKWHESSAAPKDGQVSREAATKAMKLFAERLGVSLELSAMNAALEADEYRFADRRYTFFVSAKAGVVVRFIDDELFSSAIHNPQTGKFFKTREQVLAHATTVIKRLEAPVPLVLSADGEYDAGGNLLQHENLVSASYQVKTKHYTLSFHPVTGELAYAWLGIPLGGCFGPPRVAPGQGDLPEARAIELASSYAEKLHLPKLDSYYAGGLMFAEGQQRYWRIMHPLVEVRLDAATGELLGLTNQELITKYSRMKEPNAAPRADAASFIMRIARGLGAKAGAQVQITDADDYATRPYRSGVARWDDQAWSISCDSVDGTVFTVRRIAGGHSQR